MAIQSSQQCFVNFPAQKCRFLRGRITLESVVFTSSIVKTIPSCIIDLPFRKGVMSKNQTWKAYYLGSACSLI